MVSYSGFAEVYDAFMDNVPYDEWTSYLLGLLREYGIEEGTICDLACGTGSMTTRLSDAGFTMLGVDCSPEMLTIADRKRKDRSIFYVYQDMRELELAEKVSAFVCICDGLNYILEREELTEIFKRVKSYLKEDGIFVFDLNTIYKYQDILGETTITENRDDMSFIWENFYDEDERVNEYDLTFYVRDREDEEKFLRFTELHYQRAYEIEEIKKCIDEAGMELLAVYDAFTREAPKKESERLYFVVK